MQFGICSNFVFLPSTSFFHKFKRSRAEIYQFNFDEICNIYIYSYVHF